MSERWDYEGILAMARTMHCTVDDLLALERKHDPFFAGLNSRARQAVWFAGQFERWAAAHPGVVGHLRRIHYWLLNPAPLMLPDEAGPNKGRVLPYENSKKCWDRLSMAARDARYLGLVPLRCLEDHRTPTPALYVPARPGAPCVFVRQPQLAGQELSWPSYWLHGWEPEQPITRELWIEKSTVNDVLLPLCEEYGCNLQTGVGQVGLDVVTACWERICEDGRDVVILYISDYDSQGISMPAAVARKLEWLRYKSGQLC